MHRFILLLLWACSTLASQELDLRITEEPKSVIGTLGKRVVLRCNTNIPVDDVTWHFNEVTLTSDSESSGSKRQRRKRNREDREDVYSVDHQFDSHTTSRHHSSELWQNSVLPYSNPKKVRRRKGRNRRPKHREEEFEYSNRYVRSDERARTASAKTYGIQIRDGRLVIQNLSKDNQGAYYCVVSNAHGSIRSISADVRAAYIANFTVIPPKSVLAESPAIVLPCHLPESLPPAIPKWQINGEDIADVTDGPYLVLRTGDLLVKNVTSSAGYRFRCGAYNEITEETHFASEATTLSVAEAGIVDGVRSDRIYPTSDENINVTAEVGQQLLMECVSGNLSKFIWTRDNGAIPDSAEITGVGLEIIAAASDSGRYTCKSSVSSETVVYNLRLLEKPLVEPVTPTHASLENENDITELKCALQSGKMADWEWYYNGDIIRDTEGSRFNVSSKFGYFDGFYQCFARNYLGVHYAIFQVDDQSSSNTGMAATDDYFKATSDPDSVAAPEISRSPSAKQPTSYGLTWTTTDSEVKLFSIKYYKEPYVDENGKVVHYDSTVVNVRGERREVLLDDLDPESTYTVEMVAVSDAGTRSDVVISSFGTSRASAPGFPSNNRPSLTPSKPNKSDNKRNKGKVPRSPSRPVVSANSIHEVSLMWSARGNGGSPIIGYRIERREIEGKNGWELVGETKTYPYHVTDLQRGKSYKFRVISYNAAGDSVPSSASKPYPRRRRPQHLIEAPKIIKATTQGETSIVVMWKYENVPVSSITGYYIYYRPTDSDDEDDYTKEALKSSTADRYVIRSLQPEMQYDVKIQAYNELGPSRFSNVMILEMPKPGGPSHIPISPKTDPPIIDPNDGPDRNDPAREKAYQRNTIFLITGAVIGAILIVLLITVFCYWRRRGAQNAPSSPEMKQQNGNACGYIQGKPTNHINMSRLNSNGHMTPNGTDSPHQHFSHSPHGTRCQCSRHHSNHSSLGRDANFPPYPMPPGPGYPAWGPGDYHPNIHSNPMQMYMDPRHAYYPPHGIGRWVRGNNGEFCHVIPVAPRKMNSAGGPEVIGQYLHPGGHMITRTYDVNLTNADDDSSHRPDHGYHSNEDGARTGSDSQAEKSDDPTQDDDANSVGGATSGVVTLNEVTIDSRPSSPRENDSPQIEDISEAPNRTSDGDKNAELSQNEIQKSDESPGKSESSPTDENTPFLNAEDSEHKEVAET